MFVRNKLIVFFFSVITLFFTDVGHAEDDFFSTINLQVAGQPTDYKVVDLNNNGLNDLLIAHVQTIDGKRVRFFSTFFQDVTGFSSSADQSFEVDEGAIIYDVADVAPTRGKEIVFFKNDGLYYYASKNGSYQPISRLLFKTDSIFKIADSSFLEHFDFIKDLNNDGPEEIMIPQFSYYHIYHKNSQNTYELKSELNISMSNKLVSSREISRYLVSSYAIPNMIMADYNNDQRDDIIVVQDRYLQVFFQSESGEYSNKKSVTVDFWMELTQAYSLSLGARGRFQRNRLKDKSGINTLCDLNNDGLLDIIIEKFIFSESIFNPKKKFYIFYGKKRPEGDAKGGYFDKTPDQLIVSRGVHVNSWVKDLNHDKKMDFVIPAVEIGLLKIVSLLITGSIDVTAYTYFMDDTGKYPRSPDEETTYSMKFNRKSRKIPVEDFTGDYNGDGLEDFLGSKADTLFITFGPKEGRLEIKKKDVEFEFDIPANGMNVKPEFINPDEKSDLIILYPNRSTGKNAFQKNICIMMTKD